MSDPIGDLVYETMMSGDIPEDGHLKWADLQVAVAKAKAEMARAEREAAERAATASLRDQFAIAALTGLIGGYSTAGHPESWDNFAIMAYFAADAMLRARDG